MKVFNFKKTLLIAALLASGGAVCPEAEEAIAPSPQEKARARDVLDL
jgi:hypothetical protein